MSKHLGHVTIGATRVDVLELPDLPTIGAFWERAGDHFIATRRYVAASDAATVFHELVHAALDFCAGDPLSDKLNETVVRATEVGVCQALRSNPAFAREWLERLLTDDPAPAIPDSKEEED